MATDQYYVMVPGPHGPLQLQVVDSGDKAPDGSAIYYLGMATVTVATAAISQTTPGTTNAVALDHSTPGTTDAVVTNPGQPSSTFNPTVTPFTSADASTAATLLALDATKKNVIQNLLLATGATAMTVTIREHTSNTVLAYFDMAAHTNVMWNPGKAKQPTANRAVDLLASVSGQINATVISYLEA